MRTSRITKKMAGPESFAFDFGATDLQGGGCTGLNPRERRTMWPDEALSPYPTSVRVDSVFRERSLSFMADESAGAGQILKRHGVSRRKFLGTTIAGGATVLAGGSLVTLQKLASAAASPASKSSFVLGGDLSVNRLGFGAMRLTGEGLEHWPRDCYDCSQ